MSAARACKAVLRRDLLLGLRHRAELANPLVFYVIVASLFPFAVGSDTPTLAIIGPSVIWVCALLAATLSLDRIFHADFDDGTLEQLILARQPLVLLVGAKTLAHWLLCGVPLVPAALALAVLYQLPATALWPMLSTLLLGTPVFSLTGTALAALTVGLSGSGVLLALLILPLYIPVLIFSVAAVGNAMNGLSIAGELYFLSALLVLALTVMPFAAAAALRIRLG
ncbi:MAG: heme exporter protein CcmB [Gammaproteobacteria bacterium]|nr:heme exporter protein CcmB [Gammaproteobacteria bacterium]